MLNYKNHFDLAYFSKKSFIFQIIIDIMIGIQTVSDV